MSNHTPGPWRVAENDPSIILTVAVDAGGNSTVVAEAWDEDANAHLIAAAPEMLEALKRSLAMMKLVAEDYSMGGNYSPKHIEILFSIRSAIDKAEGRS